MALYLTLSRAVRALLGATRARGTSSLAEGGTCQAHGARPTCPPCLPASQPPCRARQPPASRGTPSLAEGGGTCQARGARPVCPPCVPAPQPPCRARQPPASRGTRVVCCAPPQGARPPCPSPPPAPPLTCRDAVHENCVSSSHESLPHAHPPRDQPSGHGCEQDPVALRLQIARTARRADYEWEVACRATAPPALPACPAPYTLGGERECARATDGCTYAVLHETCAHAPSARCGPGRTPPPPRCVELAPDDACRIRSDVHVDPCAHRPRVMVEIDRSTCTTSASPRPACPETKSSSCANTTSTQAAPSSAPPRCRRPTIVERLRARPPNCQSERHTHTSMTLSIATKSLSSVAGGLEGMLRSKEQLKEAGLGRVVTDAGAGPCHGKPPDGRLELYVPPGTERVAVHVTMTRVAGGSCGSCPPTNVPNSTSSFVNFKKKPAPCGPVEAPCVPFAPTRCKPGPKTTTKRCRCSSMSALWQTLS